MVSIGSVHYIASADTSALTRPCGCAEPECETVANIAASEPELSVLLQLAVQADLAGLLSAADAAVTVFAPPNGAFAALTESADPVAALSDADAAQAVGMLLQLHVVDGVIRARDLVDGQTLPTLTGLDLTVSVSADGVPRITAPGGGTVAHILAADVAACSAVVHVIDAVLVPGDLENGAIDIAAEAGAPTPGAYGTPAAQPLAGVYGDAAEDAAGVYGDELEPTAPASLVEGPAAAMAPPAAGGGASDGASTSAGVTVAAATVAGSAVLAGVAFGAVMRHRAANAAAAAALSAV